ncbi:MAG: hypothetical protein LBT92_00455 [Rickettsiales bacterium]|jgi:hypothetical protein|nr:hypothetical protein [Rickettsiales bacterium]
MTKYILPALALLSACTNKALLELCQTSGGYVESTRQMCMKKTCFTTKEPCNETIQQKPQATRVTKNDIIVRDRDPITIHRTCEKVRCECLEYKYEKYNRCSEI